MSAVAGAIWTQVDLEPLHDVRRWALRTREVLGTLLDDPVTGVHPLTMVEYETTDPGPTWWETTPYVERVPVDELPVGRAVGFRIDGTITVPEVHLAWLEDRLVRSGGTITVRRLTRLEDAPGDVIVNCTGLGAAELVGDRSLVPVRGQVVHVANPGLSTGLADERHPVDVAYLYPRPGHVVLGGTRQPDGSGRPVAPGTDLDPDIEADPGVTRRILAETAALEPRLAALAVERVRVGLRPGRPAVRVEPDRLGDGRLVVHDYGHGGCGYLLSWGCAEHVADLVAAAVRSAWS